LTLSLNAHQKEAVVHDGSSLLIVAGPGSGKTRVIVERVLHMIEQGTRPSEILCLTFSNKAADEMKQRLEKVIDITEMQISTIHSFAKDILYDNVLISGIGMSRGIMNRQSQLVWGLKNLDSFDLQYIEIGNNAVDIIESIIDGISTFKNELITSKDLSQYLEKKLLEEMDEQTRSVYLKLADMGRVYKKLQEFKMDKSLLDFDDLIMEAANLLRKRNDIAKKYQEKFKYIFVDEFQDNNYAQLELIKLVSNGNNVTAVGDADQCIYRFQGAYLRIFEDFLGFFTGAGVIDLNENYRSTQNIIGAANQLFANIKDRLPKVIHSNNEIGEKVSVILCEDEPSEVEFVVNKIKELIGNSIKRRDNSSNALSFKDFAIMSRKREFGQKFVNGLKAHGIPVFSSSESNLFANPIIRDFIAYLKIASDPGRSGLEITKLMTHLGVTEENIAKINRAAKKRAYSDSTDIDFVYDTIKNCQVLNVSQVDTLKEIGQQIQELVNIANSSSLSDLVYKIIVSVSGLYKQSLVSNTSNDRRNRLILKELYKISLDYESLNPHSIVSDFITHLLLMGKFDIELSEGNEREDAVWVTTIHQCKGKEFSVVFVVDVATDRLPLRHQGKNFYVPTDLSKGVQLSEDEKELHIQEERRLLYVAMTRAQNLLFITYSKKHGDNTGEAKPSRFLKEIQYDKNPHINFEQFIGQSLKSDSFIVMDNIEKIKTDLQLMTATSVTQMNLKTATEKIIQLYKIQYFEENNTFDGFDPQSVLKVEFDESFIEEKITNICTPLIDKETFKLSASKLDTYKDCPLKFKFAHILEIPTPPKSYLELGSSVHTVVELLTKLEIDNSEINENVANQLLEEEWIGYTYKSEVENSQSKSKAKDMLKTFLNWVSDNKNIPLEAEKEFTLELSGVPFNGFIDRIEKTKDGEFEVIDFKTGTDRENKKSIKDNLQMNIYALAVEKIYGKLPKSTSLFYLKKDKIITNTIDPIHLREMTISMQNMVSSILKEEFKATPSHKTCRGCDYQIICNDKKV
jgi:DNA helicase-2/ATP-dependent DNA helicase PcrA